MKKMCIRDRFIYEVIGEKKVGKSPLSFPINVNSKGDSKITPRCWIGGSNPQFCNIYGTKEYDAIWLIQKLMNKSPAKMCIRDRNCSAEIEGGSVGTREAINWAKMAVLLGNDLRAAAELTVLPSVGEDPDDIALVRTCIHQSIEEIE